MRRAANIDSNHTDVVTAFRGLGCSVQSLAAIGKGCPDILVGFGVGNFRLNLLVEIKSFNEGTVKGELNDEQNLWHSDWEGQVAIVRSLEDVGRLVKAARAFAGVAKGEGGG